MVQKSTFKAQFRRRRQGKTNYGKRLDLLKSGLHRLVVRRTNRYVIVQFVQFDSKGDRTLVHVNSSVLEKFGWKAGKKSISASYLTGLLAGCKAKKAKVEKAVLDIGFAMPVRGGWWAAALKGVVDAGMGVPLGEEAVPSQERINGKHIEEFAKGLAKEKGVFSLAKKKGADMTHVSKTFEEVKQKILQSK